MKQTAVEWLKKELEDYGSSSHLSLDWTTFDELVEQALEMEKEQIMDAYLSDRGLVKLAKAMQIIDNSEKYYNETYKPNKL